MTVTGNVIENVRRSLGRTQTPATVPPPPAIPDPVARLVHSPIGLPDLFNKRAAAMKMLVSSVRVDNLSKEMAAFLRERQQTRNLRLRHLCKPRDFTLPQTIQIIQARHEAQPIV